MNIESKIMVAVLFVWLGMVLAISFLEAPLKFRAPDVTIKIGLGIGRLVFRALNTVEAVLALVVLWAVVAGGQPTGVLEAIAVALVALVLQLAAVRPWLNRRSDAVLAGLETSERSRGHLFYVSLEVLKAVALAVAGILLLVGP